MRHSPCRKCPIHIAGFSKAGEPACLHCESAREYSDQYGSMAIGTPVPLTDFGRGYFCPEVPAPNPHMVAGWKRAYDAVVRICERHDIRPPDLLEVFKSGPVTAARKAIVAELTVLGCGVERIANFCGVEVSVVYYHQVRQGLRANAVLGKGSIRYRRIQEAPHAAMPAL